MHQMAYVLTEFKIGLSYSLIFASKMRKVGGSAQPGRFERKALRMFTAPMTTWCEFSGGGCLAVATFIITFSAEQTILCPSF